ncbi:MAG: response regulator [Acidobacteria bacterium]|nr:response regulator [Acidobacteriota bacterium]
MFCCCAGTVAAILASVALVVPAAAQGLVQGQYVVDRWNTDAGLPQTSVNALTQSRDGRLWIATLGGIARFDGASFTAITTGDRTGLLSDRVLDLEEDRQGRIWIGTENGLSRYERGTITTLTGENGLPGKAVRRVAPHPDGSVWFATPGGVVGRVDSSGIQVISSPIFGSTVFDLLVTADGVIWVSGGSGVWRLDSFSRSPVQVRGRPDERVAFTSAITADPRDGVWMTTESGVIHFSGSDSREYAIPSTTGLVLSDVRAIASDGDGALWFGTGKSEVWRFQFATGVIERIKDREAQGTITDLILDREGSVWVGNRVSGLTRLRRSLFQVFTTAEGLAGNNAPAVLADSRGRIWAAANCNGVSMLDGARFRKLAARQAPPCVTSLAEGKDGSIWMGGTGFGRWHSGVFTQMDKHGGVRALYFDREGTLWIGHTNGLMSWDGTRIQTHQGRTDSVIGQVYTVYKDREGSLWLGTGRGLLRYSNGDFERFTTAQGLPLDIVRALHEDENGALWIGTYGGGLARLQNGKFTSLTTTDGLFDNYISSIMDDGSGNMWLSGNRGVFRIARSELEDFMAGRTSRVHSIAYGRIDGMLSAETNGGFQPSVTRAIDGRFWYPTLVGVAGIDPATAVSSIPPAVAIEGILVNGEPLEVKDGLSIGPGAADVEIAYSGLSLNTPNAVTFRYQLEGWDYDWIDAGTRRSANYSRLAPGNYRFRLMAANRDGVWSPDTATLAFTVLPYFWQTWWFRSLTVLALLSVPIIRGRQLRRREAELTRIVEEKTHELRCQKEEIEQQARALEKQNEILAENVRLKDDVERISRHDLRTPLSSIISLAQIARETPDLPTEHEASLKLIEQAGYRVLNMANLTLDLYKMEQGTYRLTPAAVDIRSVLDRVLLELGALMRTRNVTCEVLTEGYEDDRPFIHGDELLSHSMLSNLIKNAIEASLSGAHVTVTISKGDNIRIRIHNDGAIPEAIRGRFFEKYATGGKKGGTGLGAYSARLMAETQGGSIHVETSEERGTAVIIELLAAEQVQMQEASPLQGEAGAALSPGESWLRRYILVVDDDEQNRAILRHFLSHPLWTIDDAENGPLALRKMEENDYDFVFMDVEMPVMNGFEVAMRVREMKRRAVIVALSSHDDASTRQLALQSGFDHYLTKPASRRAVMELVLGKRDRLITLDEDLRDLVPEFLSKKMQEIGEIRDAIIRNDCGGVRRMAHRLRGAFSLYGFSEAAAVCAEIEELAESNRLPDAAERLPVLTDYLRNLEIRYIPQGRVTL